MYQSHDFDLLLEVSCGIYHMWLYVSTSKASDRGALRFSINPIKDAQPIQWLSINLCYSKAQKKMT